VDDSEDFIKGTARWYTSSKGVPGKFSLKKDISLHIPFKNGEEVIVEYNKSTGVVCIKKL
jgi:hypothetical protein